MKRMGTAWVYIVEADNKDKIDFISVEFKV